jgi:hypothetical protein
MTASFIIGTLTFIAIDIAIRMGAVHMAHDNYVHLADAFLHGRVWIDQPTSYTDVDALPYKGKNYIIEGPLPAILMIPAVLVHGKSASQAWLAAILAGICVGTAWEIGKRLELRAATCLLLCGFLLLGTDLFWCASLGCVWELAHVSSVTFTLLALHELLTKRRARLVALYAVCATESRFPLLLAIPVYAAWLAIDSKKELRQRELWTFGATLAPFVLLWVAYNEARWGLPYDVGYTMFYNLMDGYQHGNLPGSPFRLSYIPYQLYAFFMRPPQFVLHLREVQAPYLMFDVEGLALTWTSPALALAFFAPKSKTRTLLWVATLLAAAPSFLYYTAGGSQVGMRHALDFEPFLFVLMALAVRERMPKWGISLCCYSMLFGIWEAWYANAYLFF